MDEIRLLGNEQLQRQLEAACRQDKLSHSYLISGPAGSGKRTLAMFLAAAMQCTAGSKRPCFRCAQCRKVLARSHPDVVTVDDEEKKTVAVGLIRQARTDLYIRPNEGRRKIYIFPRAADMNASGENALLKVIEEPPDYGAFLFLTENAAQLLPTVRSRCIHLQLTPLSEQVCTQALSDRFPDSTAAQRKAAYQRSGGYLGQAIAVLAGTAELLPQTTAFAAAFANADRLALAQMLVPMERLKREAVTPILQQWRQLLADALCTRAGQAAPSDQAAQIAQNRTAQEILQAAKRIQEAAHLAEANVNVGTLCGLLQVQLR